MIKFFYEICPSTSKTQATEKDFQSALKMDITLHKENIDVRMIEVVSVDGTSNTSKHTRIQFIFFGKLIFYKTICTEKKTFSVPYHVYRHIHVSNVFFRVAQNKSRN